MTLEVYNISNGIPMGKAVIGGGNVEADGMIYQFMGSVATYTALLALDTTDFKPGYVYDVQEDGMDYAWTGTGWNSLGGTHADLSNYYTKIETEGIISDLPTGLELSISNGLLSAQPGHIKSQNGVLISDSVITTQDISTVNTAFNNNVIVGERASYEDVLSGANVTYIYCDASSNNNFNSMTENSKGAWIVASSSQGNNTSSWPHYGLFFNEALPAGQYRFSVSTGAFQYGFLYLCSGSIGNLSVITTVVNNESNPQNVEVNVGTPIDAIVWVVGNYNGYSAPYSLLVQKYNAIKKFDTYLCKSSSQLYLKLSSDSSALSIYDDYARIGEVTYSDALTNPEAIPTENITNAFLSGSYGQLSASKLIAENVYISGGEAAWLSYVSSGGAVLGRPDANHITLPTNSQDLIQVTRGGNTYTNVDSGNIGEYTADADSTFSDESTNALQNKVITNSLMDFNNGSYVVYGSPTINSDVISNLSTTNYIETKYKFNCTSSDTWNLTVWISGFDYTTSPFVLTNSTDGTKSIEMGFSGEKAYLKASSDGSTWDIADAVISNSSNFLGGNEGFRIEYNSGYINTWQMHSNGYSTQYNTFTGTPYNTNSPIRIYSSVTDNTLSIDLSKSAMSVNNVTVWDGAAGELICTPKFPQSSDIRTIDKLTQSEYDALVQAGTVDASTLYIII